MFSIYFMRILVFNADDALLSRLRKRFPKIGFKRCGLDDDFEEEGRNLVVLDTLPNIEYPVLVDDITVGSFYGSESIMTLRIMIRINTLDSVTLIGIPVKQPVGPVAFEEICTLITSII